MPDDLLHHPCTGCRRAVFDGQPAAQCAKCGAYWHRKCATGAGRCTIERCGSGKWTDVAVVRLEPPGPTLEQIATAVRTDFQRALDEVSTRIRGEMAYRTDVEKFRAEASEAASAASLREQRLRERVDALGASLEKRLDEHRKAVAEVLQAVRSIPTVGPREIQEVGRVVSASLEQQSAKLQAEVAASLAELRSTVVVESSRNFAAIEACRWDTAARRRPLPWHDGSDRVLEPAPLPPAEPRPAEPVQGGTS